MPNDERLARNQSDHLIEVVTDNGWVNVYIPDPELGTVQVSKYWANAFWTASGRVADGIEINAKGASLIDALTNLKVTQRLFFAYQKAAT